MIVAEDLDRRVLDALTGRFGWCPRFTITNNLPPELAGEKDVDAAIARLEQSKQIQVMKRPGNSDLFRIPPAPGEEATAPVRPDPPVPGDKKIVKFAGDVVSAAPPLRSAIQARRDAAKPKLDFHAPLVRVNVTLDEPPPARLPGSNPSPAKSPEKPMHNREELDIKIKKALQGGPLRMAPLVEKVGAYPALVREACERMAKANELLRGEGRLGAWSLANGKGGHSPAPAATKQGAESSGITEIELKLIVLDVVQKKIDDPLLKFGLMQIRQDLERFGAR